MPTASVASILLDERNSSPCRKAHLSDSESDAGQDSDQDSDFHPGVDLGRSQSFSHTSGTPHWADRTANTPILPRKAPPHLRKQNPLSPPPARRGRKPSGLSRSAREAQRKLNHSIIEKARRTKINDALATLRELIPADYGRTHEEDEEDEPDQGKKGGKKEKKEEKEFKLEILVRTVSFMKNLLERIRVLEAAQQGARDVDDDMSSAPVQTSEGKKRKRRNEACDDIQDDSRNDDQRRSKKRHVEAYTSDSLTAALPHQLTDLLNGPSSLGAVHPSDPTTNSTSHQSRYTRTSRLPSISSWLNTVSPLDSPGVPPISPNTHPLANIDPALRALPQRVEEDYSTADPESKKYSTMQAAPHSGSYLPSLRHRHASTHFSKSRSQRCPRALEPWRSIRRR
ncbi:BHLH domain-containing protein [Salix suchowensis]|nr:BHLH domain-containing protein [Salix suchowensis]